MTTAKNRKTNAVVNEGGAKKYYLSTGVETAFVPMNELKWPAGFALPVLDTAVGGRYRQRSGGDGRWISVTHGDQQYKHFHPTQENELGNKLYVDGDDISWP